MGEAKMGVFDEIRGSGSITEGYRRFKFFTDRHQTIRLFSECLNEEPPENRIIYFHGDGGIGKSLLLRMLHRHYCKCLSEDNWNWVKHLPVEEFEHNIRDAEGASPVPAALIDFGMQSTEENPRLVWPALLMMRRMLRSASGGEELRYPLYDFAVASYLRRARRMTKKQIQPLFPPEETAFVMELLNLVFEGSTTLKVGSGLIKLINKHYLGEWSTYYMERRGLDKGDVDTLQEMDLEDLASYLPVLFAKDLNVAMLTNGAPQRVALFFDTHEAFWGHERGMMPPYLYFQSDEWLRGLLSSLELEYGIVVVVAGRVRPRWADAYKDRIEEERISCLAVENFSKAEAKDYLELAEIKDLDMQELLLKQTELEADKIHPFYLGLCVDAVLEARRNGHDLKPADLQDEDGFRSQGQRLLQILLRYADKDINYAVRALSAPRSFDWNVYQRLARALSFRDERTSFEQLIGFSFVRVAGEEGEGRYRIHELIRKVVKEENDKVWRQANEEIEKYNLELAESAGSRIPRTDQSRLEFY
jgi:hypothetical protein